MRHITLLIGLAGLCLLLVVIITRLSSIEASRPIIIRVDEAGRGEAVLAYSIKEVLQPNNARAAQDFSVTEAIPKRWFDRLYLMEGAAAPSMATLIQAGNLESTARSMAGDSSSNLCTNSP